MTEQTQTSDQPTVSIADIVLLKKIVEVASTRGAFQANELTQVGAVYDRISAWIESVVPSTDQEEESSTDPNQGETDA